MAQRYPTFPRSPNALRTLEPPRFRDAYSFSGLGRSAYQHVNLDALNVPQPTPAVVPVVEAPTGPGEPRG